MAVFEVWAPRARTLELLVDGERVDMEAAEGGWWRREVAGAGPGSAYGYMIDGEGPFPDPRSHWQPEGVHALSRLVDHDAFAWTDADFQARPLAAGLVYELHIGTFTPGGTFDSAIEKLDYLRGLGVTHIELLPVAAFPGAHGWGYDGVDLYAPFEGYGGPDGLKRLVDACHARGLAVLLDVVYNHFGPSGNYADRYGPYHSGMHNTNWGQAINLDGPGSDEVRRFMIDNALMWLRDYHIDGLRLDAVHALVDNSAVHFLEELSVAVHKLRVALGRYLVLIAESELNDPRLVRPTQLGGYGLDAQWSDDFHHALHTLLTGENKGYYADFKGWRDLPRALNEVFVYNGCYSGLRNRRHGRPVGDLPAGHFLGYIQNHDQIGNRAQGERIHHLVGPDLAKVAAAIVLTAPFVPMLFMGEEWGASAPFQYFTDHEEELGRAVSEGRRGEFGGFGWQPEQVPDPQDPDTFRRSKLNWSEQETQPHAGLLAWHRALIELRNTHPVLKDGQLGATPVTADPEAGWLVIARGCLRVACNLSSKAQAVPLDGAGGQVLLASREPARLEGAALYLPPQSTAVIKQSI